MVNDDGNMEVFDLQTTVKKFRPTYRAHAHELNRDGHFVKIGAALQPSSSIYTSFIIKQVDNKRPSGLASQRLANKFRRGSKFMTPVPRRYANKIYVNICISDLQSL